MIVYRISRANRTALDGKGATLYPGRWNAENIPCIYTSETPSLSQLEMMANTNNWEMFIAVPHVLLKIEVKDAHVHQILPKDLPPHWADAVFQVSTQDFGANLLSDPELLAFSGPSAVTKIERNIILNPRSHYFETQIKIVEKIPFHFDQRLLKKYR